MVSKGRGRARSFQELSSRGRGGTISPRESVSEGRNGTKSLEGFAPKGRGRAKSLLESKSKIRDGLPFPQEPASAGGGRAKSTLEQESIERGLSNPSHFQQQSARAGFNSFHSNQQAGRGRATSSSQFKRHSSNSKSESYQTHSKQDTCSDLSLKSGRKDWEPNVIKELQTGWQAMLEPFSEEDRDEETFQDAYEDVEPAEESATSVKDESTEEGESNSCL